jgi:hypothetical protein
MKYFADKKSVTILLVALWFFFPSGKRGNLMGNENTPSLQSLLPEMEYWSLTESAKDYFPETLYEYIDGAAEIYLGYDFKQLIVGQYEKKDSQASLSVEIYDMGSEKNAFGIYSAERFPDTRFIPVGNQGYLEEGSLNFLVDRYYIKLLCFDCGEESESFLKQFSQAILRRIHDEGQLPFLLDVFPKEGLVPNTEKFILRNFMGYSFFHDGYLADYRLGDLEFQCFLIEGRDGKEAQSMLDKFITARGEGNTEEIPSGFHLKDRYYEHIFLARVENYLVGVMKIKDGQEETGKKYLLALIQSLEKHIVQMLV